jgi:uncharacterized membrane protein YraQ (UPF0718 family)
MEIVINFFENLFLLASAMSFYILLGLIIAGVLKQIIPDDFISKHLGKDSFLSILKATIFGIPLPVCSCSVIPLAKSLQKEGASSGAVSSFLIATPITGVDSIVTTYSFFGWIFTIYRVVTSIIIAIIIGIFFNIFIKEKKVATSKFSLSKPKIDTNISLSSCSSGCCSVKKTEDFSIKAVFDYAFNTLFKDIAKALFWGLIIGTIFTTFIPKDIVGELFDNRVLSYILVLVISMPLYVCATASLPIGASFLMSGLSAGATFIFLSAGPATNSITMGVVAQMHGKRAMFLYVLGIGVLSIAFGFLFDYLFGSIEILKIINHLEELSILDIISTIILFALIAYYLRRK